MNKTENITGRKFGTLTVISPAGYESFVYNGKKFQRALFQCECSCGVKLIKTAASIKQKKIPSCSSECRRKFRQEDLSGRKFNNITVVSGPIKYGSSGEIHWNCECSCGEKMIISNHHIRIEKPKSCKKCNSIAQITKYNTLGLPAHNRLPLGEAAFNGLLSSYKRNAKGRNLEFNLTKEEFQNLTKTNCHFCNQEPIKQYPSQNTVERRLDENKPVQGIYIYNGIDRLDSSVGYNLENCVACCETCNYMKSDLTLSEFENHITLIYNRLKR